MRLTLATFLALVALLVSGCGLVYKMEINQGNFITQDMVDRLREGQTRQQVRFVLGTPVSESVFHPDRWDYNFSLERRGKPVTSHRLTVVFDGDKLKSWDWTVGQTHRLVEALARGCAGESRRCIARRVRQYASSRCALRFIPLAPAWCESVFHRNFLDFRS
jgi:outer membrane protein assembly factor BamE (lipoprotein component of BamABCDE complex)